MAERAVLEIVAEADNALRELDELNKKIQDHAKRANAAFDSIEAGGSVEEARELARAAEKTGEEFVETGKKATRALDELSRHSEIAEGSQDELQDEIRQTEERLRRLRGETKKFGDQSKASGDQAAKSFNSVTKGLGKMRAAFLAVGGAVVLRKIIDATQRQAQAEALLAKVIEQTGQAAGFTADELKKMASALQEVTLFGDEAIIEGQNVILTFDKIGKEVFPRVIETALDVATLMAQGRGGEISVKEAAIQLGKALNDPIRGLSALTRVGVSFTEQQKEQIEALIETNKVREAQLLILDAMASQGIGGLARAARQAEGGAIKALVLRLGDLGEEIGGEGGLLYVLDEMATRVLKTAEAGSEAESSFAAFGRVLSTIVVSVALAARQLDVLRVTGLFIASGFAKVAEFVNKAGAAIGKFTNLIPGISGPWRTNVEELERKAEDAASAAEDLFQRAENAIRENREQLEQDFKLLKGLYDGTVAAGRKAAEAQGQVGEAAQSAAGQMDPLVNLLGPVTEGEEELGDQASIAAEKIDTLTDAAKALIAVLDQQKNSVDTAQGAVSGLETELSKLEEKQQIEGFLSSEELGRMFDLQDQLADANLDLAEAQKQLALTETEVANSTRRVTEAQQEASGATAGLAADMGLAAEAVAVVAAELQKELEPIISEVAVITKEAADGAIEITNTYEDQTVVVEKLADGTTVMRDAMEEANKEVGKMEESLTDAQEPTDELAEKLEGLHDAANKGVSGAVGELERLEAAANEALVAIDNLHAGIGNLTDEAI
jgi:chromosome segregation ATPase